MCVIAKRLGSLHKLAHTAGRRYFSSARESQHHTNLPTCLAAKKKRTENYRPKGRPRAAQSAPERAKAPQSGPSGPERSTEANPKQSFHGVPLGRAKKPHFQNGKTTYFRMGLGGGFFFCFPTLSKTSPKHAQTTPPKASRAPTVAPERPQSGAERRRATQSAPERASAPQSAQEPRVAQGPERLRRVLLTFEKVNTTKS